VVPPVSDISCGCHQRPARLGSRVPGSDEYVPSPRPGEAETDCIVDIIQSYETYDDMTLNDDKTSVSVRLYLISDMRLMFNMT
jgi:hypothetical protein